jgi:hypothetical protein
MGRVEKSLIALQEYGQEENYVRSLDFNESFGICNLVKKACGEVCDYDASAFLYGIDDQDDSVGSKYMREVVAEYRQRTGRKFPRLIKLKVVVEAEALPDEESNKIWEEYVAELLSCKRAYDEQRKLEAAQDALNEEGGNASNGALETERKEE